MLPYSPKDALYRRACHAVALLAGSAVPAAAKFCKAADVKGRSHGGRGRNSIEG
jgi:hypothetical protein